MLLKGMSETLGAANGSGPPSRAAHAAGHFLHSKAGMAGVDKEHVARVVEDASKGSAYYAKAQEREAKLEAKIDALKASLLQKPRAEIEAYEAMMDKLVVKMEASRRLDSVHVVVDFDAFFAAVEQRDDPSLVGVPFAVGGKDMISTASYEARKYGVRSAMPGFIGLKLCPGLKFVKHNFEKYSAASAQGKEVFSRYDPHLAMMSLDEAYLDITGHLQQLVASGSADALVGEGDGDASAGSTAGAPSSSSSSSWLAPGAVCPFSSALIESAVARMRGEVREATGGLTCSAGIAPNTMLAKIVSDQRKPDGQFLLPFERGAILGFVGALPVRKLPGVGKVAERELVELGFATCGDLLARKGLLRAAFGDRSLWFLRCALGLGDEDYPLPGPAGGKGGGSGATSDEIAAQIGRKSLSQERTFRDCGDWGEVSARVDELAREVGSQMAEEGIVGRTVTLKLKHADFTVTQRQTVLPKPTADPALLASTALLLLKSAWPVRLRLVGVRASRLAPAAVKPTALDAFVRRQQDPSSAIAGAGAASDTGAGDEGYGVADAVDGSDGEVEIVCETSVASAQHGNRGDSGTLAHGTSSIQTGAKRKRGALDFFVTATGARADDAVATSASLSDRARQAHPHAAAAASSSDDGRDVLPAARGSDDEIVIIELDGDDDDDEEDEDEEMLLLVGRNGDGDVNEAYSDIVGADGACTNNNETSRKHDGTAKSAHSHGITNDEDGEIKILLSQETDKTRQAAASDASLQLPPHGRGSSTGVKNAFHLLGKGASKPSLHAPERPPSRSSMAEAGGSSTGAGGGNGSGGTCPVCASRLGATMTSAEVNAHVDACLRGQRLRG